MLQPVSTEAFWASPAGTTYAASFMARDAAMNPHLPPQELQDRIARWQTGNYNPDTGLCTLYRGDNAQRLQAAAEPSGAITSRCVELFGAGDIQVAITSLRDTAKGNPPRHVQQLIGDKVAASEEQLATYSADEWKRIPDAYDDEEKHEMVTASLAVHREEVAVVAALSEGVVSEEIRAVLEQKSENLAIASRVGSAAYLLAAREASTDVCPDKTGIINLKGLVHDSIHLTTDPEKAAEFSDDGRILRVDFTPGSLPVAPERGYVDGAYQTDGFGFSHEQEWYGIGQLRNSSDASIRLQG